MRWWPVSSPNTGYIRDLWAALSICSSAVARTLQSVSKRHRAVYCSTCVLLAKENDHQIAKLKLALEAIIHTAIFTRLYLPPTCDLISLLVNATTIPLLPLHPPRTYRHHGAHGAAIRQCQSRLCHIVSISERTHDSPVWPPEPRYE